MTSLHPSILHINAKNLSESTINMINNMVEKVNEMEISRTKKQKVFEISAFMSGFTGSKDRAKGVMEFLDEFLCDDPTHLTTEVSRLKSSYEDSLNMQKASNVGYESKISELTLENSRLREALGKIIDIYDFNASEPGYDWATLDPINELVTQALTPEK